MEANFIDDRELLRAFGISVLRGIVERYGGIMTVDWENHTFEVANIPKDEVTNCALEMQEATNSMAGIF